MKKIWISCITIIIIVLTIIIIACGHNYSKEELNTLITQQENIKYHSHNMAESARALGWTDDDDLIKQLQTKWFDADKAQNEYKTTLNQIIADEEAAKKAEEAKWAKKVSEYPVATQIWRYMKAQGWNDYVCAGIVGNIMAECGGQTLNIQPCLSVSGFYGICMWADRYSNIKGGTLEQQLDYLRDTIKREFDVYGRNYASGFNYNSFLNLTDSRAAALSFSKCYERCTSASYGVRQSNAVKAYNYFVN